MVLIGLDRDKTEEVIDTREVADRRSGLSTRRADELHALHLRLWLRLMLLAVFAWTLGYMTGAGWFKIF